MLGSISRSDLCGKFCSNHTDMASGKMFASLLKYKEQNYYEEHPVMYLTTEEGTYKLELFSGYVTEIGSSPCPPVLMILRMPGMWCMGKLCGIAKK